MQPGSDTVVEMRGVSKRYPLFALDRLNLTLPQGQMLGLVGPNGAGKSTILKMLLGFVQADEGSIRVLGHDMPHAQVAVKQRASYVSEEMRLYPEQTVGWHLGLMAKCFECWDKTYASHLLKRFDLLPQQTVRSLSLGQRIKANLVLALARRPQLLVLDEPSTGLDPVARYELIAELFELMLDENNSVIFSSQYTQDVERLSDVIAFIDGGQLISCCDKESYLDQWRRIEVRQCVSSALPDGVHYEQLNEVQTSLIDTRYHPLRSEELKSVGFEIRQVQHLTLEEIFIQQVLIRRQSDGR